MVARKHFSISEAEALLPSLSEQLKRAQRLKAKLERYEVVQRRIATDGSVIEEEFDGTFDSDYNRMKERFYEVIEGIGEMGCVVRNVEAGVVDFYTKFEGREVFLCWELGARKVKFWHELDEDYTGRKRIIEVR